MAPQSCELHFVPLKTPLPPTESAHLLGRVVRSYDDLRWAYTPESPEATLTPARFALFLAEPQHSHDVRLTAHATSSSSAFADFFAGASASTTAAGTVTVAAPRVTTRQLRNEGQYFEALKADGTVRRKLLDMCPVNDQVYLVVGTKSARGGASYERTTHTGRSASRGVSLPLGAAAGAAAMATGVPVIAPDLSGGVVPDLKAGFERDRLAGGTASFTFAGGEAEEVFAVACRVVRRTWRGLGKDMGLGMTQPEYTGGIHFGSDSESDESEDEDGGVDENELSEEDEVALAQGLELGELVVCGPLDLDDE
ncbi:hypothetical protein C8A01DRAFT_21111 [Parachaetomium inaequale]|uniref:Uncharacterized protein n=1 Tax=Parachaetomium inaequale TaxID=2588326 RepID=A0AAN6SLQ3_9PEZI|nr:hypothetical protein C8A01DRAFT_21111 [Parachaetomium inaequale]